MKRGYNDASNIHELNKEEGEWWEMAGNQVIEYDPEADVLVVNIKANPKVREDKLLD